MLVLGIFQDFYDPSACLVEDGKILAYAEEERFVRLKHAKGLFPAEAIKFCLEKRGVTIQEVDFIAHGWDCLRYSNGSIAAHYKCVEDRYPVDERTRRWHKDNLAHFNQKHQEAILTYRFRRLFGYDLKIPKMRHIPHHYSHAFHAYMMSDFDEALILTIDGSGDDHCTVVWHGQMDRIEALYQIKIPNSLGWFYAAVTEYLGFEAYDGEYKVMGLAAYGKPVRELIDKMRSIVRPAEDEIGYELDPTYIFYGSHTFSERFTDKMVEFFARKPRLQSAPIENWHENVAYAAQYVLEESVTRLLDHLTKKTGVRRVCIGGGVGLNVKMNSHLYYAGLVDDIYVQPICGDSGTAIGSAQAVIFEETGKRPELRWDLYLGPVYDEEVIESQIKQCKLPYRRPNHFARKIAQLLTDGKIVALFDKGMEGGPRALGARSILADPRDVRNRDKVNAVIKYREYWRPFCPSILAERAHEYLVRPTRAPFMIMAFKATEKCKQDAPAIVHVDGSCRVQLVEKDIQPHLYDIIAEFARLTDVPVLLNTSFNIRGEPMVCSVQDALRTFFSTGLDALAIGPFLLEK